MIMDAAQHIYCAALYRGIERVSEPEIALAKELRCAFRNSECGFIALLTNRQIEERAAQSGSILEKLVIGILAAMIFLRGLDMLSPTPVHDFGCTPKVADRAVILCAVRDIHR